MYNVPLLLHYSVKVNLATIIMYLWQWQPNLDFQAADACQSPVCTSEFSKTSAIKSDCHMLVYHRLHDQTIAVAKKIDFKRAAAYKKQLLQCSMRIRTSWFVDLIEWDKGRYGKSIATKYTSFRISNTYNIYSTPKGTNSVSLVKNPDSRMLNVLKPFCSRLQWIITYSASANAQADLFIVYSSDIAKDEIEVFLNFNMYYREIFMSCVKEICAFRTGALRGLSSLQTRYETFSANTKIVFCCTP